MLNHPVIQTPTLDDLADQGIRVTHVLRLHRLALPLVPVCIPDYAQLETELSATILPAVQS